MRYARAVQHFFQMIALLCIINAGFSNAYAATSRWGAEYFPNVPLTTHDEKKVHFFDDLIKDKIVVINFIYTSCPDTCPLETAQLTRVQGILGDRLGKDIFFYSITIDPAHDTTEVLRNYRERFGANWTFLTGDKQDIISLRRKLGLYIENIQGGANNHNVSMIIGNQATGRWMKRSPFENPYVLADHIGNWLTGWKAPQHIKDFANAPELRNISSGENLFRTRCVSCHSIDGSNDSAIGPDLLGVTAKRNRNWLISWLRAPDEMLKQQDPIALKLYQQFNGIAMPNMRLSQVDIQDLLHFMQEESDRIYSDQRQDSPIVDTKQIRGAARPASDVVAIMNAWIREAMPSATVNAGYVSLVNVGSTDVTLVKIESSAFDVAEMHEMKMADGLMEMHELSQLLIPAGGQVQFKPGGKHIMLKRPKQSIIINDIVKLVLHFDTGQKQTVSVEVKKHSVL